MMVWARVINSEERSPDSGFIFNGLDVVWRRGEEEG